MQPISEAGEALNLVIDTLINLIALQELTTTMKFACGFAVLKILPRVIAAFKTPLKIPKILLTKFDYGIVLFILSLNGIFKVRPINSQ